MQLVKYTPAPNEVVLAKMLPEESKIIQRALAPKIKNIAPLQVVNEFTAAITTAYTIAGQQADHVTLALYVDEFYSKLMETYSMVTVEEVKAAIRSGVYGEYGDYYGLNPKTFIGFVRSYLVSQERKEAKRKFEIPVLQESKPTIDELEKSNQNFANTLYQDFLNDNLRMEFIPSFIYDFLEHKGCFSLCSKKKRELYRLAYLYIKQEIAEEKMASLFGKISKKIYAAANDGNRQTIVAKQISVWEYFELCKIFKGETIFL